MHDALLVAETALLEDRRPLTRDEVLAVAALPLDELPDAGRARAPRAPRVLRRRGRAREPHQRQVGCVPGRLRVLLAVGALLTPTSTCTRSSSSTRCSKPRTPRATRAPRSSASWSPCAGRRNGMLTRVIEAVDAVQRETGLEVACSLGLLTPEQAERLAAAGVQALQPQPRSAPGAVPVDLHHPHLRRPRRDRQARHRRRHGAVLRRHPRHGRDARAAGRLRVRAGRARRRARCRSTSSPPPARRSATSA